MKTPRRLKGDVSNKFPYLFQERKVYKNKSESAYDKQPQTSVSGTKHTIITDKNKIIHRNRLSNPLTTTFRIHSPNEGKTQKDGRFTQMPLNQSEITTDADQPLRESTPILEESMLETTLQETLIEMSPVFGRGKKILIRNRTEQKSPRQNNLQMYLENMTEDRQEEQDRQRK